MTSNKPKILLGSPIHQKPDILKEFLSTIAELQNEHYHLNYFFIDNNEDPLSKQISTKILKTVMTALVLNMQKI